MTEPTAWDEMTEILRSLIQETRTLRVEVAAEMARVRGTAPLDPFDCDEP